MRRKRYLPPSPLAHRQLVNLDFAAPDPEQNRVAIEYFTDRFDRLARDKKAFPSEFDRLLASSEAWARGVYAKAGLRPGWVVSHELYPQDIWYASQIWSLAAEIRRLREKKPDLVLGIALTLGELIGEARAHLMHGQDAARGLKAMRSAHAGHEQVHGTKEAKEARWQAHVQAYQRYRAQGHGIGGAEGLAAEERGVHRKSIYNARRWAKVD
jgi:hypothetical protein